MRSAREQKTKKVLVVAVVEKEMITMISKLQAGGASGAKECWSWAQVRGDSPRKGAQKKEKRHPLSHETTHTHTHDAQSERERD